GVSGSSQAPSLGVSRPIELRRDARGKESQDPRGSRPDSRESGSLVRKSLRSPNGLSWTPGSAVIPVNTRVPPCYGTLCFMTPSHSGTNPACNLRGWRIFPCALRRHMLTCAFMRLFLSGFLLLPILASVQAASVSVPNGSFEAPRIDFALPEMASWQKAAQPF